MSNEGVNISSLTAETNEIVVQSPEWFRQLKAAIDYLIVHDFARLVHVLYQADIAEERLKNLLQGNRQTDASEIIAQMLLQRQLQKIAARKMFSSPPPESAEDAW